jgi:hypothetical protein
MLSNVDVARSTGALCLFNEGLVFLAINQEVRGERLLSRLLGKHKRSVFVGDTERSARKRASHLGDGPTGEKGVEQARRVTLAPPR